MYVNPQDPLRQTMSNETSSELNGEGVTKSQILP
jgi:hypothetical protein